MLYCIFRERLGPVKRRGYNGVFATAPTGALESEAPMSRLVAQAVGLVLLAGCGRPPAPAPPAAPAGSLRADLPRLEPVARFRLPGQYRETHDERRVQLSADGKRVALGSDLPAGESLTQVWQLAPQLKLLFTSPTRYCADIFALSPGGERLVTASTSSPEAFDVDAGTSLGLLRDTHGFTNASFRDESVVVWAACNQDRSKLLKGKVFVWDVDKNADAGTFEIADARFSHAYPARDGTELWLFRYVGRFEVECYDVATKRLARTISPESYASDKSYQFSEYYKIILPSVVPDGSVFVAVDQDQRIYDGASGRVVGRLPSDVYPVLDGLHPGGTRCLARTTGNKATGGAVGPNDLVFLDWKSGRGLAVLGGFSPIPPDLLRSTDALPRVGFSADGKTAVIASRIGEVLVFDLSAVP